MSAVMREKDGQPSEFFRAAMARLMSAPVFYTREQMAVIDAPAERQLVSGDPQGRYHLSAAAVAADDE